jgi:selenocysteine lyase/cysteine desulfurase
VNVIAFARALRMIRSGNDIFRNPAAEQLTANDILYHDELEKYSGQELLEALRHTLIGRGILVPTAEGASPYINLDNSASTPTFIPVWNAVRQTWRQPGPVRQEIIREVRSICAGALGAPPADYEVIFTSNTTEAINLAAESLGRESRQDTEPVLLGTLLEHSSNDLPWRMVSGLTVIRLSVDMEGFVDLNGLESLLRAYNQERQHGKKRIEIVAVSGASNVLGVFNDLAEISRIVHRYGARLLVDAAQLIAHRRVGMESSGIDYLAFSAHKVYAPFGCGVLVVKKGLMNFSPAEMELIRSSGEENAGGIAALGKALVLLQRIGFDVIRKEEQELTARALRGLMQINGLAVYGIRDPDSPGFAHKGGVIPFVLKDIIAYRVAKELALRGGIGVRSGCHCAHVLVKHLLHVSPGLERFQRVIVTLFPKLSLPGIVRVSLGIENRDADVDALIHVLGEIAGKSAFAKADVQRQMDEFVRASAGRVYGNPGKSFSK